MDILAVHAEAALHRAPHPALRLSELVERVAEGVGRPVAAESLRTVLEARPDRFRVLETWRGPWRIRERDGRSTAGRPGWDAWVVAVEGPDPPPDAPKPALRLRESVRWVALGLDHRSRVEASRWYAIALAERAAREAVARRAA